MPDRRPIAISIVILMMAVFLFAATFFVGERGGLNSGAVSQGSDTRGSHSRNAPTGTESDSKVDRGTLPQDIAVLEATPNGKITGKVLCGNCAFNTGEACNVMLYDESNKQLAIVLPNEHYDGLNALVGAT